MTTGSVARLALALALALLFTQAAPGRGVAMQSIDDAVSGTSPAGWPAGESAAVFPQVAAPDPVVAWMVGQVDRDTIYRITGDLSGEWPVKVGGSTVTIKTRDTQSGNGIKNATRYAGERLAGRGLAVEYHRWGPADAPNVIGQITGKAAPADVTLIGAHLDDLASDSAAPGADDNASGSVAVLVAADILSQFEWNCTLRFALWTGEEDGLLGSESYAHRAKDAGEKIRGALNADMIGWNTPGSPPEVDFHARSSLPATVELARQAASVIVAYNIALAPEVWPDGEGSSDHASFWKFGYSAILAVEDLYPDEHDFNPYYHTTGDRLARLDMGYYTEYVKAMVAEMATMSACLVTGTAQGRVRSDHDGAGLAGAEVALTDAAGRAYRFATGEGGAYGQAVPPDVYQLAASAYGYGDKEVTGLVVPANGTGAADVDLVALPPTAIDAIAGLERGEVRLTWRHVSPNTSYEVRRSSNPYFAVDEGDVAASLPAGHPPATGETLSWRNADSEPVLTGWDDFYLVVGRNAAGAGLPSNRVGKIDFALVGG